MRCQSRRPAFTLVELIVVIGIILVLVALGAAFMPALSRNYSATNAANSVQGWLLGAKLRAKRDGIPTGLRFLFDPQNPTTCREMRLIQQPPILTGGSLMHWSQGEQVMLPQPPPLPPVFMPAPPGAQPPAGFVPFVPLTPGGANYISGGMLMSYDRVACVLTFGPTNLQTGLPFTDFSLGGVPFINQWLVQPGDSISVEDGSVRLITGVVPPAAGQPANQLQLAVDPYNQAFALANPTTNYAIYRNPRLLIGEPPLILPAGVLIDFQQMQTYGMPVLSPGATYYDLCFSPLGQVRTGLVGRIHFWMRMDDVTPSTTNVEGQSLVTVNIQTGAVGVYDVAIGNNPFFNTLRFDK